MRSTTALLPVAAAALSGAAIARAVTSTTRGVPDAKGVFHGCYRLQGRDAGLLRVLPPADPCPSGTTAVSWNAQGQPGPAGPPGPQGAQGPAGVAGGTVYGNSTPIAGGSRAHVTATCPSGTHALGGGGTFSGGAVTGDALLGSYPSDSSGSTVGSGGTASAWTAAASTASSAPGHSRPGSCAAEPPGRTGRKKKGLVGRLRRTMPGVSCSQPVHVLSLRRCG